MSERSPRQSLQDFIALRTPLSVPEQPRREFVQSPTPRQKFVTGIERHIEDTVEARLFQRVRITAQVNPRAAGKPPDAAALKLAAAEADESQFDLFPEPWRRMGVIEREGSAAEEADIGKLVEIGRR